MSKALGGNCPEPDRAPEGEKPSTGLVAWEDVCREADAAKAALEKLRGSIDRGSWLLPSLLSARRDGRCVIIPNQGVAMLEVGKNYFVRTITDYWNGRLVSVEGPRTVVLVDFSWVSQTGRLTDFLRDGRADGMEIEPAPDGMLIRVEYVAITTWPYELLRKQVP